MASLANDENTSSSSTIPAPVWIGIGVLVSIISVFNTSMRVFIVAGVLFIAYGTGKIIFGAKEKRSPGHTYNTKAREVEPETKPLKYKRCFLCSAKNHPEANYCGHCGNKL